MMRRSFVIVATFIVLCVTLGESRAAVRRMECREWIDKKYHGIYQFSFDDERDTLLASYKPEAKYPMFGQSVEVWKLLWKKDLIAVFYGIADDWWAPVKVLSLHFGKAQMFPYGLGSDAEESTLVGKIDRQCKRLD